MVACSIIKALRVKSATLQILNRTSKRVPVKVSSRCKQLTFPHTEVSRTATYLRRNQPMIAREKFLQNRRVASERKALQTPWEGPKLRAQLTQRKNLYFHSRKIPKAMQRYLLIQVARAMYSYSIVESRAMVRLSSFNSQ